MRRVFAALAGFLLLALLPHAPVANAAPQASPAPQANTLQAGPTADQLLAKVSTCQQISSGRYAHDEGGAATVPVCQNNGVVFFSADMDIDCDGVRTTQCNENTDCCFYPDTAFHTSTDQPLNAAQLPYIVLPQPTSNWDYRNYGIDGGSVVAVIYQGRVEYAVVGDTGPTGIIGEASYATAAGLGIDPDPSTGGTEGPVTYIVFPHTSVNPIENHDVANSVGEDAANRLVGTTTPPAGSGAIVGLGGKCMDVAGANSTNGTAVQLYDCNGSAAQAWTATNGTLRALGKCLDVRDRSTANGAKLQLWDCTGGANQQFTLSGSGTIVNPAANKCVDVTNKSTANSTPLQLWTCTGATNQKWTLS
ncbi:RICIN domain-containing protein [Labedaea rhizosphaerae]|uniref:Chitosanase (Glycosyl hydrolase group 75) n=1 Tax=Labedaea rhizosphaerae TaxID=598644 RepID=A0A4R6S344_LABRH|nr:RICIN domain-containing protein [Labedaea rhizosphaerae]TDP94022.1 chitosanase (glycosyl hydrolase group 75) [Labedaea rhizosphaerae]